MSIAASVLSLVLASGDASLAEWPVLRRRRRRQPLRDAATDHARERGLARGRVELRYRRGRAGARREEGRRGSKRRPSSSTARSTSSRRSGACSRSIPTPAPCAGSTTRASTAEQRFGDFGSRGVSTWLDEQAAARQPVPPAHLRRDHRRAAHRARCGRRTSPAGLRLRRHDQPAQGAARPALRVLGIRRDLAAARDRRASSSWARALPTTAASRLRAARSARSTRRPARCAGAGIPFRSRATIPRTRAGKATRPAATPAAPTSGPSWWAIPCAAHLCADLERSARLLRRLSRRAQRLREFHRRRCAPHRRHGRVALPDRASRSLGLRQRVAAAAHERAPRRARSTRRAPGIERRGQLFVLDRRRASRCARVEERSVPASDVRGERAWPTQPFTAEIEPLSPHRVSCGRRLGVRRPRTERPAAA